MHDIFYFFAEYKNIHKFVRIMDPAKSMSHCMKLILVLMIMTIVMLSHSIQCPSKCKFCNAKMIKCPSAGLTQIPKDIPLTATDIDLSNNPLLPINRSYFLRFNQLQTLLLNNANLKGPVHLPISLTKFGYSFNQLATDSLKMMISKLHSLKNLELQRANLNIKDVFPILPRGIESLNVNGNNLTSL